MTSSVELRPFHIAFPVASLDDMREFYDGVLREFYDGVLECPEARSTENWVDFDLFGNSVSAYLHPQEATCEIRRTSLTSTPSPSHPRAALRRRRDVGRVGGDGREAARQGRAVTIGPLVRCEGRSGEQATIYFSDPCVNVIEFKAFRNDETRFPAFDEDS